MKRFLWGIALLLTVVGQSAYADSIPNFNITQATMFVGVNNGTGDNIFFDLTGPGTNISGDTGAGCFDWYSRESRSCRSLEEDVGRRNMGRRSTLALVGLSTLAYLGSAAAFYWHNR